MKLLKFKDSKGKIHEFKNVKLFTGVLDKHGEEIWEGDVIISPGHTRVYSSKNKTVLVRNKVVVRESKEGSKTTTGIPIRDAFYIGTEQLCDTEWKSYNWSEFFDCEKEK